MIEDIKHLREKWDQRIDDTSLRIGSTTLRKLLVNDDLQKTWGVMGFRTPLLIEAVSLKTIQKLIPVQNILIASAGGAKYNGVEVRGLFKAEITPAENQKLARLIPPKDSVGIKEFLRTPCLIYKGQAINRKELICYVANKLGGAHFDEKRENGDKEKIFLLLDEMKEEVKILDKNVVFFELLAIGQAVAESKCVEQIVERAFSL